LPAQRQPTMVHLWSCGHDGAPVVTTNEPPHSFHLQNLAHLQWKEARQRSALHSVAVPGSWYPDERFLRLWMVRKALPPPATLPEALSNAMHLLDVVTVPPAAKGASQRGTDAPGDHTHYGVIYDHSAKQPTLYWRRASNHNLMRVRLADVELGLGARQRKLQLNPETTLPWFTDAAHALK